MGNGPNLRIKVEAVERDLESLLKLLGGTPDQREEFWEILKGITSVATFQIAEAAVDGLARQVANVNEMAQALHQAAQETAVSV